METFAIYSVAKNHKNSFMQSVNEIKNYVDGLQQDYENKFARVKKLSDEKKSNVDSLESKFHKYNLKYREPLITNSMDAIKQYAEELQGQIAVSIPSLTKDEADQVLMDSLNISSEIARIESINKYIDIVSRDLLRLEDELSIIRIPEADSKEEVSFNFKKAKKDRKENKKVDKSSDFFPVVLQDFSDVPSNIFKDNNDSDVYFDLLDDTSEINDENDVVFSLKKGESLAKKVENVYESKDFLNYIYEYKDNKKKIDEIAQEKGVSPLDVCNSTNDLTGVNLMYPLSIDLGDEKKR